MIKKELIGTIDDHEVFEYTMQIDDFIVKFLNYGGYLRYVGNENTNFILNYPDLSSYENDTTYLGCIVGRTSGRTSEGKLFIDDQFYQLAVNNGIHHLHGGNKGFNKKFCQVESFEENDVVGCRLYFKGFDLEENYPGNVDLCVTYLITYRHEFKIVYDAVCDKKCPLNFTQHVYFNLNANKNEDISNHYLKINADRYGAIDQTGICSSLKYCLDALDLKEAKSLKDILSSKNEQIVTVNQGIDHPFMLNQDQRYPIVLTNDKVVLKVATTYPSVVCYTGNYLDETQTFNDQVTGKKHLGICFECQYFPNSNAHPEFGNMIFEANQPYHHQTVYKFEY